MEEDKILYQLKQNTIYEDLYDEVTTWLVSLGNTSAQKHFAGVYMYDEIGVDYSKEGYCGITVKTPKGYDMLDYAIRVADKFGLNYRKTNTVTRDVLIIYIKDRTKAVSRTPLRGAWIEILKSQIFLTVPFFLTMNTG